jgi:hypothetical protein
MSFVVMCLCYVGQLNDEIAITRDPADDRFVEASLKLTTALKSALAEAKDPTDFDFASELFHLAVVDRRGNVGAPIFASYSVTATRFVLKPKFPLLRGVRYRVIANVSGKKLQRSYFAAKKKTAAPTVSRIFPSSSKLPANCLKFYIHFSKPMREGRAIFEQIEIRDEKNKVVHDPWRRTELWNKDATRLTLWIHPGRVKQGVNLREEFGPVLEPNQKYRLVITDRVRCADGSTFKKAFVKSFRTIEEDRSRLVPTKWKVEIPQRGTRQALVLRFPKPLDRALLLRMVSIHRDGRTIRGQIVIGKDEQSWLFAPQKNWEGGKHSIRVSDRLEDVAGNTPLRVFDTDLKSKPLAEPELEVNFQPTNRR